MDTTHLHLILTHFPIVGTLLGIGIFIYGQIIRSNDIKKTALLTFIFMAVLTIPVYLTGEEAEESVEHLTGVSESLIENHEELAEQAIWLMGLLGVSALINIWAISKKMAFSKTVGLITLIIALLTFGLFAQVGNLGGKIRHSEIRNSTKSSFINLDNHERYEDDDD